MCWAQMLPKVLARDRVDNPSAHGAVGRRRSKAAENFGLTVFFILDGGREPG